MDEHRRLGSRQKSFLRGRVYFRNRLFSFDCLVRDISPAGARLIFAAAVTLPDIVELYIPHKDESYRCQVQWHRGDEIGVAFNPEEAGNAPPASFVPEASLAERMQQLETEIVALRNIIKELKSEQGGRNSDVAFTVRSASGKV